MNPAICVEATPPIATVTVVIGTAASFKSLGSGRRRVLHFLYGPCLLPHGLRWHIAV